MDDVNALAVLLGIVTVGGFIGAWVIRRPPSNDDNLLKGTSRGKRYMAYVLDQIGALLAFALGGIALARLCDAYAESIPKVVPGCAGFAIYFAYFLIPEAVFSTTPAKAFYGLRVLQLNGERCNWRCALIRTGTRLFEVNPLLLGGLPAALAVWNTLRHQRIGDLWAGTVVTSRRAGRISEPSRDSSGESG